MKKPLIVLIAIIVILCSILPTSASVAFAITDVYSDVLDDLQVDNNFNVDDYPVNQTEFSLQLIQLAESNANELLAYVYQPSVGKFGVLAKKIRISLSEDNSSYQDFNLTYLTNHGQFYKYKVDGYITDYTSTVMRTYNVVQLMRSADERCGDILVDENNNKISYVPYPVGWTFYATTNADGKTIYGKEKNKTITVTDKYCGQLLFENAGNSLTAGLLGSVEYGMLHFIAFNADITIDELYQADVSYTIEVYEDYLNQVLGITQTEYKDKIISSNRLTKTLHYDSEGMYQGDFLSHKYTWKEIMSRKDFVNNVCTQSFAFYNASLTEKGSDEISDKEWVLILGATEITNISRSTGLGNYESRYTRSCLTDETILRLEGKSQGKLFNLGVVDNYQTGDGVPDNIEEYGVNEEWWKNLLDEMEEWLKIFVIIVGIVLFIALAVFVAPAIWKIIKFVAKIIFAPFRWLFGSHSSERKNSYKYKRR